MVGRLIDRMKAEFGHDRKRVCHALRVLEFARGIRRADGGSLGVVVAAAVLHDIGIPVAERKYGSAAAKHQETEGPPVARRILEEVGFGAEDTEHFCKIVASHHSGDLLDTPEFRAVWDADVIVNWLDAGNRPTEAEMRRRLRTSAGLDAARDAFGAGNEDQPAPHEEAPRCA